MDHLVRATAGGVRAFAAITTDLTEEARERHDCYPIATAALGRTMAGALLLAATLKTAEAITIKVNGNGPLGNIVADATPQGAVRGFVDHPHADLPLKDGKLDVGTAVGKGEIYITRFTGMKEPFTGSVELVSGEIAEDITQYLYVSEQTPSTIALGVRVNPDCSVAAAGGLMVQALPDADDKVLEIIEANLNVLPPLSELIAEGLGAQAIIKLVFSGLEVNIYDTVDLKFRCNCSRERMKDVLASLNKDDLDELIADGEAEMCCHFCNEKHVFIGKELEELKQ